MGAFPTGRQGYARKIVDSAELFFLIDIQHIMATPDSLSPLQQVEACLDFSFEKVLDPQQHLQDRFPASYRAVMTPEEEMVRDWHGKTAFVDAEHRLRGINLYGVPLEQSQIDGILKVDLPDLQALNLNQTGISRFVFTAQQSALAHVNLSQNESLIEVRFDATPLLLQSLDLYDSRVKALDLPKELNNLERLDASRNQELAQVNFKGACPRLTSVDLSENALSELDIPAGFAALQDLFLRKNQLVRLGFSGTLPSLGTLDVRENQLQELPDYFLDRAAGATHLFLYNNPWESIKDAVSSENRGNSRDSIFSLLTSLRGPVDYLFEAKMILVGNGLVGKTSIRRKLIDEKAPLPDKEHGRTPVIEIDRYPVTGLPPAMTGLPNPKDFVFNIWDFGGQGHYREIQQIFCSHKSLYLFVTAFDDKPEQKKNQEDYISFEYWLDMVSAYGHNEDVDQGSPILIVVNKIEKGYAGVDKIKYLEDYPHIYPQEIGISCKTLENFGQLRSTIQKLIPRISADIFTTQRNQKWLAVKQVLESRKADNYLSYDEYLEICRRPAHGLSDQDARTWIGMLDRIGTVIYFDQHPALSNRIILDPEWVQRAMVAILDNEQLNRGLFNPTMYKSIWPENLPEEREAFVALMLAYKLCYERKDAYGDPEFVVPACLPAEQPPLPDFLTTPSYQLRINYSPFVPAGTVNKLIVTVQRQDFLPREGLAHEHEIQSLPALDKRQGRNVAVYNNLMWKNNVIFHDPDARAYAHVREEWDNKRIDINLFGQDVRALYEYLESVLQQLNDELKATRYIRSLKIQATAQVAGSWLDLEFCRKREELFFKEHMTDLQKLIQNGEIDRVFDLLEQYVNSGDRDTLVLLRSRWNRNEAANQKGTLGTGDYNVEYNRITAALNGLAKDIHVSIAISPNPVVTPASSNPTLSTLSEKKILFLAANPDQETRIQTDREHRILKAEYERGEEGKKGDPFLPSQFAVTIGELQRALDANPSIIHFSGHGDREGIIITDEQNQKLVLGNSPLKRIFRRMQGKTELVILNACFSASQAEIISGLGICVIGAHYEVLDDACIRFSKAFYSALGRGKNYQACYDEAITAIGTYYPDEEDQFEAWQNGKQLDW